MKLLSIKCLRLAIKKSFLLILVMTNPVSLQVIDLLYIELLYIDCLYCICFSSMSGISDSVYLGAAGGKA